MSSYIYIYTHIYIYIYIYICTHMCFGRSLASVETTLWAPLHRHRLSAHMIRPPPKRRRPLDDPPPETLLQRLVHVGGVSAKGLLKLLEELRATHAEGLPDTLPHTQHGIGETIHARFDAMSVELDMPLIIGDGIFKWPLVDPNQLVARSIDFSTP